MRLPIAWSLVSNCIMLVKSPQSFLFCCLYFFLVFTLFYVCDFLVYWCIIEISTIVFVGIGYRFLKNRFSFFLIFFVIQRLSAFLLLVFFVLGWVYLFTFSFFLKLAMFPFHFWFVGLVQYFPNLVFFMIRTIFKIPRLYILLYYPSLFRLGMVVLGSLINLVAGGALMCRALELRFVLMCSSVSNNSWMLIAALSRVLIL
jgi:hypothetical protein